MKLVERRLDEGKWSTHAHWKYISAKHHCSFHLKLLIEAVKHQQLFFLFTQIMITGAD